MLKSKTDDTSIVLVDFGLAQKLGPREEVLFKRCGTPGYVAPEVLLCKDEKNFYD